jgi:hypothetical protein
MHIHTTAATPAGDALAGFQAARTASALRRARELSDAAARLKARSQGAGIEEDTASFASLMAANPAAQSPSLSQGNAVASVTGLYQEAQEAKDAKDAKNAREAKDGKGEFDTGTIAQDFYRQPLPFSPLPSSPGNSEAISRASPPGTGVSAAYTGSPSAGNPSVGSPSAGNPSSSTSNANPNDWLRPVSFWA